MEKNQLVQIKETANSWLLRAVILAFTGYHQIGWSAFFDCKSALLGRVQEISMMKTLDANSAKIELNSFVKEFPNVSPAVVQAYENLLAQSTTDVSGRARRIVQILIRFGYRDNDLLVSAILSAQSALITLDFSADTKITKILAALNGARQEAFNQVIPLLSISNPDAAVIKVAEQIVDVEGAIVSVAAGTKEPWLRYREQFASTLQIRLPGNEEMWNYLERLCQSRVPSAAFHLGDVYIDFAYESVKIRFEKKSGKVFSKFYGKSESELSSSTNLFRDATDAGELISRADYAKP
jgi:hypothetical protein